MMKTRLHAASALAPLLIASCSPYSLARPASPPVPLFGPPVRTDVATLCVIRPSHTALAVTFAVHDNHQVVGATCGESYFCYQAEPGLHRIVSFNEGSCRHRRLGAAHRRSRTPLLAPPGLRQRVRSDQEQAPMGGRIAGARFSWTATAPRTRSSSAFRATRRSREPFLSPERVCRGKTPSSSNRPPAQKADYRPASASHRPGRSAPRCRDEMDPPAAGPVGLTALGGRAECRTCRESCSRGIRARLSCSAALV